MNQERNKLRELLDRKTELEKVERSIIEVRDMFIRISALVIDQVSFSPTILFTFQFQLVPNSFFTFPHPIWRFLSYYRVH